MPINTKIIGNNMEMYVYVDAWLYNWPVLLFRQDRSEAMLLKTEERLRGALMPRYQQLFGQIGKVDSGVKFLVDMRVDVLVSCRIISANF